MRMINKYQKRRFIMIGFVYIWYDINRKMFYIGSHVGDTTDGYVCSNKRMLLAYKKRPNTFKRRVLAVITGGSKKDVQLAEQRWLEMIKDVELSEISYEYKSIYSFSSLILELFSFILSKNSKFSISSCKGIITFSLFLKILENKLFTFSLFYQSLLTYLSSDISLKFLPNSKNIL